ISGNETITSKPRSLQLQFLTKISCPVFTGKDIEGEECEPIKLALVDRFTREVVKDGAEAAAGVEILILEGELEDGKRESWTREEFNDKIVREWEGKKSILRGDTHLKLKEGTGTLGRISITHNSGWMKNCKLRIGARVVDNSFGISIKEAISESFPVKDRRSTLYEKHYPPSMCDEVWRLKNIDKKGAFYKRLTGAKITTVKDFLTLLSINPRRLQEAAAHTLVESASEHWEEVLPFDDESVHMLGSLQSMHSSGPDSLTGRNFVTSPMIDDPEVNNHGLFVPDDSGQGLYGPIWTPDFDQCLFVLNENHGLRSESPPVESHANQETDATDFLLIDPGPSNKVLRRWIIMVYSLLQWVSVWKKVGALEGIHDQKKQRVYYEGEVS
ncbi:hypothetical protein RJ639_034632, partial [Escallonia herrerae]